MAHSEMPDDVAIRRHPTQRRSQERVTRILDTARVLLGENGYDGLSMAEVARRAEVPIGTVYQFFPNAAALVRRLGELNLARIDAALATAFSNDAADLQAWVQQGLQLIADAYGDCPSFIETWAGMQANPASRALDLEDTLRNADELAGALAARAPAMADGERRGTALAMTVAGGAIERLALQLPDADAQAMRAAFGKMVTLLLRDRP